MKISTKQLAAILKLLSPVARAGDVLIQPESDGISITAFDGNQMQVERFGEMPGLTWTACVNLNHLQWSLNDAEETELTIGGEHVVVQCGRKVTRLATGNAELFEVESQDSTLIGVNCEDVAAAIKAVLGFEHVDRDPLTNLYLEGTPKCLSATATNGKNAAIYSLPSICATFEALVPSAFAVHVAHALARAGSELRLSGNRLTVTHSDGSYWCKLAAGVFLSTKFLTDAKRPEIGEILTAPLIDECESCLAFASKTFTPAMHIKFSKDGIATEFDGSNSQLINNFDGQFPDYSAIVSVPSLLKSLRGMKSERCQVFADDRCMKFHAGNLDIYAANMCKS